MTYLIWSYEHNAWWGPDSRGYRRSVDAAGRYSESDASRIVVNANINGINEIAIPESVALRHGGSPSFHPYDGALAHA